MRIALLIPLLALACSSSSTAPTAAEPAKPQVVPTAAARADKRAPPAADSATNETCEPLEVAPFAVEQTDRDPEPVPLEYGDRLAAFYRKVARLLRGKADDHIRIAVYGDSNLIADYQTGQMRRRLHERFGDAGHGLVSVGKPWWVYKHMDVQHGSTGWVCYNVSTDPAFDRLYGLTGIAAEAAGTRGSAYVATVPGAPTGRTVDAFEVFYLARKGVTFDVRVDGGEPVRVAHEEEPKSLLGVHRVDVPDAHHKLDIEPRGWVRVFGVALERKKASPSFVVDSFGVGAMNSRAQATKDPKLEKAMLQHRGYDLIIFHSGHNDGFTWQETPKALASIVKMHREALPDAPILMMTPADRGKKETFSFTRIAVEQRREIAVNLETALWDLWKAMGGRKSMARFKARGLALSDYAHFNEAGGSWAGDRLLAALWQDLARWVAAHPRAGCD